MKPESAAALQKAVMLTQRGEDHLDNGIIDLAFDCLIDIRKEIDQVLKNEYDPKTEEVIRVL